MRLTLKDHINLFVTIVSFGKNEFYLVTGFKVKTRNIQRPTNSSRLRRLYFKNQTNKKQWEAEKEFIATEFRSDEDAMKVALVFFIDCVMMGKEKKQRFGHNLLGLVDDWEVFCNYD